MVPLEDFKTICRDADIYEECAPVLEHARLLSVEYAGKNQYSLLCESITAGIFICSLYNTLNIISVNTKEYVITVLWSYYGYLCNYLESNPEALNSMCPDMLVYRSIYECETYLSSLSPKASYIIPNISSNILSLSTNRARTPEAHIMLQLKNLSTTLHTYKNTL